MEALLHYVWKHKIFPLKELKTTTGQQVEVIDTGLANTDAGPDFFNAKLKLDGVLWIGNIEIHERSSDWFKHGHHADAGYNSVILHIASEIDTEISRSNGERIPQIQLICPEAVRTNYKELLETDSYPPCYRIIPSLPPFTAHSWMTALQMERFEQQATLLNERLKRCQGNWEDAFFITLARNFGFGLNGDAFETWAHRLPFRAVDKHRNDLFQIEAIFFGQAGILEDSDGDGYYGPLYEEEYIKETAVAAIQEGIDVAKAAGVKLKSEDPEYPWYAASEGLPETFKTSILQSLELKRPTEIDFINGSVVEWGKKFGIPTPVNRTLVTCVKGIEKFLLEYEPSLNK